MCQLSPTVFSMSFMPERALSIDWAPCSIFSADWAETSVPVAACWLTRSMFVRREPSRSRVRVTSWSWALTPSATVRAVVHCIRTHRFRKRAVPRTLEARILFDADKLDSIGAVGVGRAFLFAGEIGARLHDKDIDVRRTKPYTREDTAYREYLVKLRRLKDRMTTREGKRLAAGRHRFMAAFFTRLNKETDGEL